MKILSLLILFVLLLFSCGNKHPGEQKTSLLSNLVTISDNEDRGVKDILNFYGGVCEYSIGASLSTDEGKNKYFEVKLSKSESLDKFSRVPEVAASNIAYLFFKSLKGEKRNYDEIHSVLLFRSGSKFEASYSIDKLELIAHKLTILDKVVDLIKNKKFEVLKSLLSDGSYTPAAKSDLMRNIQKIELSLGNIKGFRPYGFKFETLNGYNVLNILGIVLRDKENTEISLKVDLKPSEDKVHFLDYKLSL
ncbi:hypothetical protein KXD93_29325 [Mucilaginibacter sp. BJC16-A38]|uniref:hypothetical protein n=1 Tax=Mucilaginibacter phenanthrenivorans TaxID=1234842 RepID=UPI00215816E9|nr:hypothetical protein [Mucilaginibacter phenanthrenivorans]MCR8561794.1 hypothetical protein [Mucilaginibacter phenanthrenivorans]